MNPMKPNSFLIIFFLFAFNNRFCLFGKTTFKNSLRMVSLKSMCHLLLVCCNYFFRNHSLEINPLWMFSEVVAFFLKIPFTYFFCLDFAFVIYYFNFYIKIIWHFKSFPWQKRILYPHFSWDPQVKILTCSLKKDVMYSVMYI